MSLSFHRSPAQRLHALDTEGAFRVAAEARALESAGHDVVHLEIGEPDADTPTHITDAAVRALRAGHTHYAPPPGLPRLRAAIAESAQQRGITATAEQVVVTSGAKPAILYALLATLNPGDEVLVPDPGFPIYASAARLAGAEPVSYPIVARDGAFHLDRAAIAAAVSPRTRAIVLNSPHNPTGWTASKAELRDIATLALEHDLWIISDEIYDGLVYRDGGAPSIAALPGLANRTIVIDGFSKRYAMTGWRLGYGIFPVELVPPVTRLVINSTSCVAPFVQLAGIAALEGPQAVVGRLRDALRARRDVFVPSIDALPGLRVASPDAAFYAFADVRALLTERALTTRAFADALLREYGVAALPGDDFGSGGTGFIRFSFAAAPAELDQAIARIGNAAAGTPRHQSRVSNRRSAGAFA